MQKCGKMMLRKVAKFSLKANSSPRKHIIMPSVNKKRKKHEDCRSTVCAVCLNERGSKIDRIITNNGKLEGELQKLMLDVYSVEDARYPIGLCTRCR